MKKEYCYLCKEKLIDDSDTYEYREIFAHEKCFDEAIKKRDFERQEVMQETEHTVRSQADGEWHTGGYKTMKTDAGGRPITKVKEPMRLKEYEGR